MSGEQRARAIINANKRRQDLAQLRKRIKGDREYAATVFRDPPDAALDLAVVEVLVLARSAKGWRSSCLGEIGGQAVRDGVNLMMPLGRASARTREWAATEGLRWARYGGPRTRNTYAADVPRAVARIVQALGGRAHIADVRSHPDCVWSERYVRTALSAAVRNGGLVRVKPGVYEVPDHIDVPVERRELVAA